MPCQCRRGQHLRWTWRRQLAFQLIVVDFCISEPEFALQAPALLQLIFSQKIFG